MRKGWRIIITIVLIVALLGAVSVGVGLMTGAEMDRIYSVVDERYNVTAWLEYYQQVYDILAPELAEIFSA